MLFVCYPKCSTCKKAQKWLDESDIEYTLRDIKTDNPTAEELKAWWEKSGLPLKRFFNTSGNIYKEMKLKDKLPEMSEEDPHRSSGDHRSSGIFFPGAKPYVGQQYFRSWNCAFQLCAAAAVGYYHDPECGIADHWIYYLWKRVWS